MDQQILRFSLYAVYFLFVALVIGLERLTVSYFLKHHEDARKAIGILTVMLLAFPLVPLGSLVGIQLVDPITWLLIFGGFVVSYVVAVGVGTIQDATDSFQRTWLIKGAIRAEAEEADSEL